MCRRNPDGSCRATTPIAIAGCFQSTGLDVFIRFQVPQADIDLLIQENRPCNSGFWPAEVDVKTPVLVTAEMPPTTIAVFTSVDDWQCTTGFWNPGTEQCDSTAPS
jgi:hypothetical protein